MSNSIAGNDSFTKVRQQAFEAQNLLSGVEAAMENLKVPADDGQLPLVTPVGADVALSDAQVRALASNPGFLLVDGSGLTAAVALTLGVDSAARAAELKKLLGINDGSPSSKLLHFKQVGGPHAAFALSLENTSGTSNYVQVSLNGGAVADTQVLYLASADSDAYVVASSKQNSSGEEQILMNIVYQGSA